MSEIVIVALIGAIGTVAAGLPAVLIERARRENSTDHAIVRSRIRQLTLAVEKVSQKIGSVDNKLDKHLKDHKTGDFTDEPTRRATSSKEESGRRQDRGDTKVSRHSHR